MNRTQAITDPKLNPWLKMIRTTIFERVSKQANQPTIHPTKPASASTKYVQIVSSIWKRAEFIIQNSFHITYFFPSFSLSLSIFLISFYLYLFMNFMMSDLAAVLFFFHSLVKWDAIEYATACTRWARLTNIRA